MKYEFHVGDYDALSNKYDTIHGYVKEYMKPTFSSEHCFVFQWDDGTQTGWSGNIQELPHNFVRIGQYDFTKKGEGKIEKIDVKKAGSVFTGRETAIIDTISNKVNELIEVVNRLEDTFNEMV